jgi:hypothetical protein
MTSSAETIINTLCSTSIQINTSQYLSVYKSTILPMMFFVISITLCPNSPLLCHLPVCILYQPLCWVFWLCNLIAIAIGITIYIIIAIFIISLTTAIALFHLYLPTAFHLLPLPFFVFAFEKALFTRASASLLLLQNSLQSSVSLLPTTSKGSPSCIQQTGF